MGNCSEKWSINVQRMAVLSDTSGRTFSSTWPNHIILGLKYYLCTDFAHEKQSMAFTHVLHLMLSSWKEQLSLTGLPNQSISAIESVVAHSKFLSLDSQAIREQFTQKNGASERTFGSTRQRQFGVLA